MTQKIAYGENVALLEKQMDLLYDRYMKGYYSESQYEFLAMKMEEWFEYLQLKAIALVGVE